MTKIRLFYIPHAGGSAVLCKSWQKDLGKQVEVQPLEMAGRGIRFRDNFFSAIPEILDDFYHRLKQYEGEPYIIYGHSFGALLTYELYYRIKAEGMPLPVHLFFSGSIPPQTQFMEKKISHLPDETFIQEVMAYEGLEQEILENKELMEIFMPVLRADFRLLEDYQYQEKLEKIKVPATVLYSSDIQEKRINEWGKLIESAVDYQFIDGGHFFLKKNSHTTMAAVMARLNRYIGVL